jgi:hypothetical protein
MDEWHLRILEALGSRLTSARELAAVIDEPSGDVAAALNDLETSGHVMTIGDRLGRSR